MKKYTLFTFISLISIFLISWGAIGHRTVGKIAENHLTSEANAAIRDLLGDASLADVSVYADEIRSQKDYRYTAPWHYINLPLGLSELEFDKQVDTMKMANIYNALLKCEHDLQNKDTSRVQKIFALKFIVHLVGDMHQPMHVSREEDQGGNKIAVTFDSSNTNLHSLWDGRLIAKQGLTYEQMAVEYDQATPEQIKQWQSDPIEKWLFESYQASSKLYMEMDEMKSRTIGEQYYKAHLPIIEERIEKGGIRLAGLLNEIFKGGTVN